MGPAISSENSILKITQSIWELEYLIKDTKWWQFSRRIKYKNELINLKGLAFQVGFEIAIRDLEKIGILQKIQK